MQQLPADLVNVILAYDGRIKYRKGEYVNVIPSYDKRYEMLEVVIKKKISIMMTVERDNYFHPGGFYFEVEFETYPHVGIVYDCYFSKDNTFELCYFDFRNCPEEPFKQIRTFL